MGKLDNKTIIFRFVPTMKCNLRCSYCFLGDSEKSVTETMFDKRPVEDWIKAMDNFKENDVEFYMWGGEPFCINETYELVKRFAGLDHVKWARIDHNMTFAEKIIERCPTSKVKLNCSWHTERFSFEEIYKKALLLKRHDMIGMINFVASRENLSYLKKYNLKLDDIIKIFMDEGIFMNVAADFNISSTDLEYRKLITQYMTFEDWNYIHNLVPCYGGECGASESFFYVDYDGNISICADDSVVGNFFTGELNLKHIHCNKKQCVSIVSYCHQYNNNFSPIKHLEDYAKRMIIHRRNTGVIK